MKRFAPALLLLVFVAGCACSEKTNSSAGDRPDIVSAVKEGAAKDCGCKDCAAKGCEGCGPGCDVCKFHLKPAEDAKERGSAPK